MKWFFTGLAILCALLVLLFFNLPASLVPQALAELEARRLVPPTTPRIELGATEGTVWNGSAATASVVIDGVTVDLGRVGWTLDKFSLLQGMPHLTLTTNAPDLQATANVVVNRQAQVAVTNLEGRMAIAVLEPWVPMLVTGDIGFFIDHWVFTPQQLLSLAGLVNLESIDWVGADHNMPLGSYMAELSLADQNRLSVVINDLSARLGIAGTLAIDPGGNYRFEALLKPREGLAPEVAQSIRWFGRDDGRGNILVNKRGRF